MGNRTCADCGVEFTPIHSRNTYCAAHRGRRASKLREYHDVTCVECGKDFRSARETGKLCSDECRRAHYRANGFGGRQTVSRLPVDHPVRKRIREAARPALSPLRTAIESGNHEQVIALIRQRVEEVDGCWIWQGRAKAGYAEVKVGSRYIAVHRLTLEAKWRRPLGSQAAHHTCAVTACVNPDHLQPVTARENTAEMLARTYMTTRIAELEAALSQYEPDHPLLAEIGVVAA